MFRHQILVWVLTELVSKDILKADLTMCLEPVSTA